MFFYGNAVVYLYQRFEFHSMLMMRQTQNQQLKKNRKEDEEEWRDFFCIHTFRDVDPHTHPLSPTTHPLTHTHDIPEFPLKSASEM